MSKPNLRIGTYTGNAAAQNISLGFVPDYVRNRSTSRTAPTETFWFNGMAAASGIAVVTTAGPVLDTTNQVTAFAGDSSNAAGFTVGTDLSTTRRCIATSRCATSK
jgi:hypothetical protein